MNKVIVSIICITVLVSLAMWRGIDGALYGIGIAAIAGLGGYVVKTLRPPK